MFHEFATKEERKTFGNTTAFIELQYCKMSKNSKIKKILSIRHLKNWKDDSLYIYVDDIDLFVENYSKILNDGTYNNQETGLFDIYGYNYYNESQVKEIIDKIIEDKPIDYEKFLKWLEDAQTHNGFYLIGI